MGTFANSEDPDEMLQNAAFHQGMQCLLTQNQSLEKEIQCFLEDINCDSSIYTIDHPDFIVCNFMEYSIGLKRVERNVSTYLFCCFFMKTFVVGTHCKRLNETFPMSTFMKS